MTNEDITNMRLDASWMDNEGKVWYDDSITQLSQMYFQGVGITEMAYELKRSEMAIMQKINQLELNSCTIKPRNRRTKTMKCLCNVCPERSICKYYQDEGLCILEPQGEADTVEC